MGKVLTRIESEFVLRTLQDSRQSILVKTGNDEFRSVLTEISNMSLTLYCSSTSVPDMIPGSMVEIYFLFRNTRMKAETNVVYASGSKIILSNPGALQKHRSRYFERIPAREDWKITCILQGEQIELDFPKAAYNASTEDDIRVSSKFDASKVADLLKAFREKVKSQSTETKIVMFRERKPEAFEEILLAKTGLILYLPSSQDGYPDLQLFADKRIITNDMILHAGMSMRKKADEARMFVDKLLVSKKTWGILSEVYCPILYQEYVVGYIYLMSSRESGKIITPGLVSFIQRFSQVLSHSLKANGYFKSERVEEPYSGASLIDVSGSGLLFSIPDKNLSKKLSLFSDMDIILTINNKNVRIKSDIIREFKDDVVSYFGIQFKNMDSRTRNYLTDLIYQSQNPSTYETLSEP